MLRAPAIILRTSPTPNTTTNTIFENFHSIVFEAAHTHTHSPYLHLFHRLISFGTHTHTPTSCFLCFAFFSFISFFLRCQPVIVYGFTSRFPPSVSRISFIARRTYARPLFAITFLHSATDIRWHGVDTFESSEQTHVHSHTPELYSTESSTLAEH